MRTCAYTQGGGKGVDSATAKAQGASGFIVGCQAALWCSAVQKAGMNPVRAWGLKEKATGSTSYLSKMGVHRVRPGRMKQSIDGCALEDENENGAYKIAPSQAH